MQKKIAAMIMVGILWSITFASVSMLMHKEVKAQDPVGTMTGQLLGYNVGTVGDSTNILLNYQAFCSGGGCGPVYFAVYLYQHNPITGRDTLIDSDLNQTNPLNDGDGVDDTIGFGWALPPGNYKLTVYMSSGGYYPFPGYNLMGVYIIPFTAQPSSPF